MEYLIGLTEFVKTEKGIKKITLEKLMDFVPEYELWRVRNQQLFFYTLFFKVKIMSCIKKSYQTKKEARKFALYIKKKFKVVSKSYPCKKCGEIHLTTR